MTTDDLTTNKGYMNRFWQHVQDHPDAPSPMKDALNCVESELRAQHGLRRYSSLRSFTVVKSRKRSGPPRFRSVSR